MIIFRGYGFNKALFTVIYEKGLWFEGDSKSGRASGLPETQRIARELARIRVKYQLQSLVDLPCGDCHWQFAHNLGFSRYIGVDVVEEMIDRNKIAYASPERDFLQLNILEEGAPVGDIVLCRDLMIHLSNTQISSALRNLVKNNTGYVAISTAPRTERNANIPTGASRCVNLEAEPFNLPPPIEYLADGLNPQSNRVIGLWRASDIHSAFS